MRPDIDPDLLAPHERLREVAAILAAGLLRLRARSALPTDPDQVHGPKNLPESGQDCLEVPAETGLSVHTG
jgi:hypothetical protein